jgi:hypothetical protein
MLAWLASVCFLLACTAVMDSVVNRLASWLQATGRCELKATRGSG